jgi:hypothetical protein
MDFYAELAKARQEAKQQSKKSSPLSVSDAAEQRRENERKKKEAVDERARLINAAKTRKEEENAFFKMEFDVDGMGDEEGVEREKDFTLNTHCVLPVDINHDESAFSSSLPSYTREMKSLYYVPNYLGAQEADRLYDIVTQDCPDSLWTELRRRRLLCFGGLVTDTFYEEPLPAFMRPFMDRIDRDVLSVDGKRANHVLINEVCVCMFVCMRMLCEVRVPSAYVYIFIRIYTKYTPSLSICRDKGSFDTVTARGITQWCLSSRYTGQYI